MAINLKPILKKIMKIENFRNVGKNCMVSILDIFEKNPYSRIPNTNFKDISILRKKTGAEISHIDRFR